MRIVVTGASGNVGTSLLQALAGEPAVDSVVGVARRRPQLDFPKTEWATADVAESQLLRLFRGADVVVHLAWLIQPTRDRAYLWHSNVEGSTRVFRATCAAIHLGDGSTASWAGEIWMTLDIEAGASCRLLEVIS